MKNIRKEKLKRGKPLLVLSLLMLMALGLAGCGGPNIDEEAVAGEAYNRFNVVLDKSGWTNMNYGPSDFSSTLDGKEITIEIQTGGFYNFVEGLEQNYRYYRDIGIHTLEENGKYLFEEDDKLDSVRVVLWSTATDSYGKSVAVENMRISLDRDNFNKIDWDGLKQKMIFDTLDASIFTEAYIRGS